MTFGNPLVAAVIGASLLVALPAAASPHASAVGAHMSAKRYLNGGIGSDQVAAMHKAARRFPLHMTFSERKNGEYVANVPVVIDDAHGKQVFKLANAGPLLYVRLPNGQYTVKARFEGRMESQHVTLDGKSGKNLYFHWTGKPKA